MGKPPAAETARCVAVMSIAALEAIALPAEPLQQSPENRTSYLLIQSRRGLCPAVFLKQRLPQTGMPRRNSSKSLMPIVPIRRGRFCAIIPVWKKAASGPFGIEAIRPRFYDLPAPMATPDSISLSACVAARRTFLGKLDAVTKH
jgi:hypothetical protein